MNLVVYLFEAMSGLMINFSKSEILMILDDNTKDILYPKVFDCQLVAH